MAVQFSFAPNRSYFVIGSLYPYAWSDNTLPARLLRLIENRGDPLALDTPYDVAFPMEPDTFCISWKATSGKEYYEEDYLGPQYARLADYIRSVGTKGERTARTVFGPGASYFSTSPSGYSWQNLPLALEVDIQADLQTRRPTTVALGVQGSYVVLYDDGTVKFDLHDLYHMLESCLLDGEETARRTGITYVALNPFVAGEYYAVYGDGSTAWNLPPAWSSDVIAVSGGNAGSNTAAGSAKGSTPASSAPRPAPVKNESDLDKALEMLKRAKDEIDWRKTLNDLNLGLGVLVNIENVVNGV
ncbi:hypothetical protein B0H15DRAFT_850073 [Mycena belliarum]|uniref:Uncharacterized protein n=1 Tax=Mycena belliarum TaxID=1033014 RepID=A0AAD6U3I2_9AGAR|nr:hypothetical protein B0H15DRAFT_850073 [Mycena belliae]